MNKRMIIVTIIIAILFSFNTTVYAQEMVIADTESFYTGTEQVLPEIDIPLIEDSCLPDNPSNDMTLNEMFASVNHPVQIELRSPSNPEYNQYNGYYDDEPYDDDDCEQDYDDEEYYEEEYDDVPEEMWIISILLAPFRLLFSLLFFL